MDDNDLLPKHIILKQKPDLSRASVMTRPR